MGFRQASATDGELPRSFYETLGVRPGASEKEIRSAWRRTALKYHPDRNPGDEERAKEHFQQAQNAYEYLSKRFGKSSPKVTNRKGRASSKKSMFDNGWIEPIDVSESDIDTLVEERDWSCIKHCAFFAAEPCVQGYAMDRLADAGRYHELLDLAKYMYGEHTEQRRSHAFELFERDLDRIMDGEFPHRGRGFRGITDFLVECTDDPRVALKVLSNYRIDGIKPNLGRVKPETAKFLVDIFEIREDWEGLAICARQLTSFGNMETKKRARGLLFGNIDKIARAQKAAVLEFVWGLSESENIGRSIVDAMAAEHMFDGIAQFASYHFQGRKSLWEYSLSFLKNHLQEIVKSGQQQALSLVWMEAGRTDGLARSIIDAMAAEGQWNGIVQAAGSTFIRNHRIRRYCASVLGENVDDIIDSGQEDALVHLWENAQAGDVRQKLLEGLAASGNNEVLKTLLDKMADEGSTAWLIFCARDLFENHEEVREYSIALLERNVYGLISHAEDAEDLVFFYLNSGSESLRNQMWNGLINTGKQDAAISILDAMADEGKWGKIRERAAAIPHWQKKLRAYPASLLERNLDRVIESDDSDSIALVGERTRSDHVRHKALAALVEGRRTEKAEKILNAMAKKGRWAELKDESENMLAGYPELKAFSISLLERNLSGLIADQQDDVLWFLWENAQTEGTRPRILRGLASNRSKDTLRRITDDMAQKRMWKSIMYCAAKVYGGISELRGHAVASLLANADSIIYEGEGDVLSFLYSETQDNGIRQRILDAIMASGDTQAIEPVLDRMAEEKDWLGIVNIAESSGDAGIKRHSVSLLEAHADEVVGAGERRVLEFICQNTGLRGIRDLTMNELANAGLEAIEPMLDDLVAKGRWGEIAYCAFHTFASQDQAQRYSITILLINMDRIIASGKTGIPELVLDFHRSDEFKEQVVTKAFEKTRQWMSLAYYAEHLYGPRPRRYALGVLERHVDEIIESGEKNSLSFLYRETMSIEIRHRILGGLVAAGDEEAVMPIIDHMAEEGSWTEIVHRAENLFSWNPGLRGYAMALLEANVDEIIRSRNTDVARFIWDNSTSQDVLEKIEVRCPQAVDRKGWRRNIRKMLERAAQMRTLIEQEAPAV